ncbi:hypothetical protein AWH63_06585 [Marinobacter sp. C18]|uniref:hypothetical protein n=1 Tax=Marinobacter sp. C18 TaxID=1772288 RepID=UPI000948EFAA|nr:hypothetical protein [Marinobacter sp. C18]OLF82666.1 hypothetical protein AWH63_06585 [Marinobacter sp. C18]
MSNQRHSLINAVAGTTGTEVAVTPICSVNVSASTWGGQSVTLQTFNEKTEQWAGITDATFTANANQVLRLGSNQKVRAVTSGSAGTMAGVNVYFALHTS